MSLPIPLSVRLSTSRADRHVTRELRRLSFTELANGGFASLSMALDRPLGLDPDDLRAFGRVYVYDRRSTTTVWEGRLNEPGRGVSRDGQVWEVTARGPMSHMWDRAVPMIYVDRDLSAWVRANNVTPGASDSVTEDPGGSTARAIVLQFPSGSPVGTSSLVAVRYGRLIGSGQKLARIAADWDAGQTNANFRVELFTGTGTPGGAAVHSVTLSTSGGSIGRVVVTDWANGHNVADLVHDCNTTGTPGDDLHWVSLRNVAVRTLLRSASGAEVTTGYTASTVLASQVFADLVGRLVPQYDGANAVIDATSHPIDHLARPDGVTPGKLVEDDLLTVEPDYRWGAYESNSAGLHRVEWVAWPTEVRYECEPVDGLTLPEPSTDLYNEVTVRYRDEAGQIATVTRSQTVQALTDAGITRTAFLDLGDEIGSLANAQRAGDVFLAEHAVAANAGRLTVARPILDHGTGQMVWPWEVKAGELIRVRGVRPRIDALNATDRDGSTIFRVWSKEVSDGVATLELDSYARSVARVAARAARVAAQRRRR